MLSTTEWIILIAAMVVGAVAVMALISARTRRRRHAELVRRFGPEYDREVAQYGSVARAERELLSRERRVHKRKLRALPEAERAQFYEEWSGIQARFVDDPEGAVQAADQLIKSVMQAKGYAVERFDQRVSDLSVEHAGVVQHYRAAHELAEANREGRANTEELRQAVVHYRALFADLLESPRRVAARYTREDARPPTHH
jgi:hypothetical protein